MYQTFTTALYEKNYEVLLPLLNVDNSDLVIEHATEMAKHILPDTFIIPLGNIGTALLMEKRYAEAITVFALALNINIEAGKETLVDLSMYCNALYAIQKDNNGLPINKQLNLEFLEKCLTWGPKNPAIFFNAACVYTEMEEFEHTYMCINLAKKYNYESYDAMIDLIKTEPFFSSFRETNYFENLQFVEA
jgi:tetratricopeptide (TPR) repeat protein